MPRVLCRVAELAEGEARGFGPLDGGREKAFVVRKGERVYAFWDACPLYGDPPLAWRTNAYLNAARDRIVCASHGAEFEIETGRCVLGAALGKSLRPAPIEVTPSGEIIIKS
jgi:nitrite reductase/ring-hydroxylating ferredoxin subunit